MAVFGNRPQKSCKKAVGQLKSEYTGSNFVHMVENNGVSSLSIKISTFMAGFWDIRRGSGKKDEFCQILAYETGPIKSAGPKCLHMAENMILHLFKSKLEDLWTVFWDIGPQVCQ